MSFGVAVNVFFGALWVAMFANGHGPLYCYLAALNLSVAAICWERA